MKTNYSPTLAIAAIFKNEGPYILEWIAFHRAVGVDRFFIADNDSTDSSSELLAALDQSGIITLIPFPTRQGIPPQLPAYEKIIEDHSEKADWFAFIDADEFLYPTDGETSVKPTLIQASQNSEAGAIAVNWANFGSSNLKSYHSDLVINRFTFRAPKDFVVNQHFKSIVRTSAYKSTHQNPHIFYLNDNFKYIQPSGNTLNPDSKGRDGLSENVCWKNLRLNHYIVKSHEEFLLKKSRGRATISSTEGLNRTQLFFNGHDRNDEQDIMNESIMEKTKDELVNLKIILSASGTNPLHIDIPFPKAPKLFGCIDQATFSNGSIEFIGWAFFDTLAPITFHVNINNHIFEIDTYKLIDRPDVERAVSGAPLGCGFKITISTNTIPEKLLASELELNAATTGTISRVLPGAGYAYPKIQIDR